MKTRVLIAVIFCVLLGCRYDVEPNVSCDTSNVTYSSTITGIINSYGCLGSSCHGGTNPGSGFRLDSYDAVKAKITDGRLFGAINHFSGFIAMPKDAGKMSQCDIDKVKAWIDAGALNN
jgi:cytochrome c5